MFCGGFGTEGDPNWFPLLTRQRLRATCRFVHIRQSMVILNCPLHRRSGIIHMLRWESFPDLHTSLFELRQWISRGTVRWGTRSSLLLFLTDPWLLWPDVKAHPEVKRSLQHTYSGIKSTTDQLIGQVGQPIYFIGGLHWNVWYKIGEHYQDGEHEQSITTTKLKAVTNRSQHGWLIQSHGAFQQSLWAPGQQSGRGEFSLHALPS